MSRPIDRAEAVQRELAVLTVRLEETRRALRHLHAAMAEQDRRLAALQVRLRGQRSRLGHVDGDAGEPRVTPADRPGSSLPPAPQQEGDFAAGAAGPDQRPSHVRELGGVGPEPSWPITGGLLALLGRQDG